MKAARRELLRATIEVTERRRWSSMPGADATATAELLAELAGELLEGSLTEAASQLLDDGLGDDAPLRVHVLDLAAKWSALAGDGRGKREGVYANCAFELRRVVNHAPAAPSPTPKPLTTEARAVLVAWLPGYDDPIAWWATDDREAFLDALVSCAIDQRRAQTDPTDEQPTDHEISRDFRAAVRIEAVKP